MNLHLPRVGLDRIRAAKVACLPVSNEHGAVRSPLSEGGDRGDAVTPCVLAIDVEPTARRPSRKHPRPWTGYPETVAFASRLRAHVRATTGADARFFWAFRMDPQIETVHGSTTWALEQYPELLRRLRDAGDEVGLHTHAWRWSDAHHGWRADHADAEWVDHCLRVSFDAYRRFFHVDCRSFRFGDRFLSQAVVRRIEREGVHHDLTLEPAEPAAPGIHDHEAHTGELPDTSMVPRLPYRAAADDFRRADPARTDGPWFLPLTAARWRPEVARGERLFRRVATQLLAPIVTVPPYLQPARVGQGTVRLWESPRIVRDALEQILSGGETPVLAFAIRTDMVLNPLVRRRMWQNLSALLARRAGRSIRFCTPAEAISLWNQARREPAP